MTVKTKGKTPAKKGSLKRSERVRLMADTGCDERTIRRWERGESVKDVTMTRLGRSAVKLGIPVPERGAS